MVLSVQSLLRKPGWTVWLLPACLLTTCLLVLPGHPAQAQGKAQRKGPEAEKISGKITQVEAKGKAATLTVEGDGGQTLEVLLTAKTRFSVSAPGEVANIQPKMFLVAERAVESNNLLFARKFDLYVGGQTPPATIQRDPKSPEVFYIAGMVTGTDKEGVVLNVGGALKPIRFEQGAAPEIRVFTSQIDLIKEGAEIEMEGNTRNGKFLPSNVVVSLAEPLTADELSGRKAKVPPKATAKATPRGKKAAGGEPGSTEGASGDDPFGFANKKKGAKTEAPMTDPPLGGEANDPFGFNKKDKAKDKPAGDAPKAEKPAPAKPAADSPPSKDKPAAP